ncbi:MAG: 6-carboxytetrahydropterin synthase QueD [Candidatus Eisenbacteria bacterium]|nr:6-carboxytetrahydropterin synthase QueD [Candidatus Eisenbacteria bacterium]
MELVRSLHFQAAHHLPNVAPDHKCRRMHGHAYRVEVCLKGPVDPQKGWLLDFGEIGAHVEPLRRELDHTVLNEIPGLENPTAELLAGWIWKRLQTVLPHLHRVSVFESETSGCHYYGDAS